MNNTATLLAVLMLFQAGCAATIDEPLENQEGPRAESGPPSTVTASLRCETHRDEVITLPLAGAYWANSTFNVTDARPGELVELRVSRSTAAATPSHLSVTAPTGSVVYDNARDTPDIQLWKNVTLFTEPAANGTWQAHYRTGHGIHADVTYTWIIRHEGCTS